MCGEVEKKNVSFYETHRFVLFFRNVSFCGLYNSRKGDIDDNGDVNVSDVTALINVILGN